MFKIKIVTPRKVIKAIKDIKKLKIKCCSKNCKIIAVTFRQGKDFCEEHFRISEK